MDDTCATMVGSDPAELVDTSFEALIEAGVIAGAVADQYGDHLEELLSSESDEGCGGSSIEATLLGQDLPHTHEARVALLPYEAAFQRSAAVVRDVTEKRRPA